MPPMSLACIPPALTLFRLSKTVASLQAAIRLLLLPILAVASPSSLQHRSKQQAAAKRSPATGPTAAAVALICAGVIAAVVSTGQPPLLRSAAPLKGRQLSIPVDALLLHCLLSGVTRAYSAALSFFTAAEFSKVLLPARAFCMAREQARESTCWQTWEQLGWQ
jgi:hypothetical protein